MPINTCISKKWHEATLKNSSLWQNKSELYGKPRAACYHFAKKTELLNLFYMEAERRQDSFFRWCQNSKAVFWYSSSIDLVIFVTVFLLFCHCTLVISWLLKNKPSEGKRYKLGDWQEGSTNYLGKTESMDSGIEQRDR